MNVENRWVLWFQTYWVQYLFVMKGSKTSLTVFGIFLRQKGITFCELEFKRVGKMCFLYTHSSFAIQGKVWLKSLNIMDLKVLWRKFIKSKNNEIALFIIKIAKKKQQQQTKALWCGHWL